MLNFLVWWGWRNACLFWALQEKRYCIGLLAVLVQKQATLFRCDIKEEQQLFTSVAPHERIKISPSTMLSSENIVIQINNLCQEISSAQLGLFYKNLVKSPNFDRVSRQQTISGCFNTCSCRCVRLSKISYHKVFYVVPTIKVVLEMRCCRDSSGDLQKAILWLYWISHLRQTMTDTLTLSSRIFSRLMSSALFLLLSSFILPLSHTS